MDRSIRTFLLAFLLIVYILLAGLYAVRTPRWQAPDEPAHFNYVRAIAETGTLPILQPGDYDQDYLEKIKSLKFPAGMSVDAIRYEAWQPPLYYLAAVPFYLATGAGGVAAQVLALRLFSVLLGAVVLLVAFAIVRAVFPDDALLPLAAVGAMATLPMHLAVAASISNDLAAELLVALMLWLGILRLKNQVTSRRFVLLGGLLFGAGMMIKSTTYVPGASVLIVAELGRWMLLRNRASADPTPIPHLTSPSSPPPKGRGDVPPSGGVIESRGRSPVSHLGALFALALMLSSPMFIRNVLTYGITDPLVVARHETVVVGQPTTAEMTAQLGVNRAVRDFMTTTLRSFWAQFGWMGVLVDERIYLALFALTAIALVGLALHAWRVMRNHAALSTTQRWCLFVLALLLITAVGDYVGYNGKFWQPQGRYLFPALVPIALFFVLGLREILAKEHARLLFALLYLLMVGLDIAALFLYIVPQLTA